MDNIKNLVKLHYKIEANNINKLSVGAGSNTYYISSSAGRFILKNANVNEANNPQNEPELCEFLLKKGLSVSVFIKNVEGYYIVEHENALYHLQKFVDGINYEWNTASDWLLIESAQMLGKIHAALKNYPVLPMGIGENFFKYMTPKSAIASYEATLIKAKQINDMVFCDDISFRIDLMKRFAIPDIDINKLTCKNTHGDFFISQLICGDNKINAVIDWTTACVHPVVWEIIRSYVYAAPECKNGEINTKKFISYVSEYLKFSSLTEYDIKLMPYVFYFQISVCDYYNQYYQSTANNRDIYLQQAILSTKLMRWFDKNISEFSSVLLQSIKP